MVVQGRGQPDEFYVHKPMLRRASSLSSGAAWVQAAEDGCSPTGLGRPLGEDVEVSEADRHRFCLGDEDG